jgi:regulation of enolase protein 1 (concanavalin A-like superfamily)
VTHQRFRSLPRPVWAAAALAIGTTGIMLVPAAAASAATMSTLYASPSGSGTACTSSAPCSLAGAQSAVRSLDSSMTGDIVVELAGGTYRMSAPWTFTSSDSATNGYAVDWQAESGQTPVVSGGVALTSWTEVNSADNIWAASLPSGVSTRDLWLNGSRVTLAQDGALPSGTTQTSTGYTVPGDALQSLADPSALQFVFNPGNWVQDECGVASISGSTSSTTVTMDEPCYDTASASGYISLGLPAYIENNASFLTGPNQWSFNSSTSTVDLIPPAGVNPNDADVEAGNLPTVLQLNGTSTAPVTGVGFSGITFQDTTWPAVNTDVGYTEIQADVMFPNESCATEFSPASFVTSSGGSSHDGEVFGACNTTMPASVEVHAGHDISLTGDTFTNMGTSGVTYDGGTQNSSITGNSFTDIGGNAVQIGSVSSPNQTNSALIDSGDTVSDNYINAAADEYQGGVGIWAGYTKSLTITHNDIENLNYSGVSTGWGWGSEDTLPTIDSGLQITDNYVTDTNHTRSDGGPLYSLGPQPGADMTGNYLTNPNSTATEGMYLDQGSTDWTLNNNVLVNFNIPLFNNANSWDPCGTNTVTDTYITGGLMNGGSCTNVSGTVTDVQSIAALQIESNAGLQAAYQSLAGITSPYQTYASTEANSSASDGTYTINAAGADVWETTDQYGAIYVPSAAGTTSTTTVEVDSQADTNAWAKAGLMIRDSIPGSGSSLGYAALALTPGNGVSFQWDDDSSGGLNTYTNAAVSATSIWLRFVRSGSSLTGEYSTNGTSWTTVATETLTGADATEDVGMFASSHDAGVQGQDVFSDFSTTNSPFTAFASTSASIVDSSNPNTTENSAAYTIDAAGAGPWSSCCQTTDQYGALYEAGAATTSSTTTVEVDSQSDTNAWAMSGIMLRNSISGSPGSLGYAALAVTPGNGVALLWDDDSSGYLNQEVSSGSGSVTAPIWLKLTRSGSSVSGAYSTNDSTWTTVGTETLTGANSTEDVGMFGTSFDAGLIGQSTFSNFTVAQSPFQAFSSTSTSIVDSGSSYTLDAAGAGPWSSCCQTTDQYGALYQPAAADSSSSTTVEVTSQSNTNAWAMAGIMLRDSISGSPGSLGYAALALTPGNGVALLWDDDSSGYLNNEVATGGGTLAAPIWLRLTRSGTSITGYYSTNDSTWTTVGTETLTGSDTTEDVGMFATSFDSATMGQAGFSGFGITG